MLTAQPPFRDICKVERRRWREANLLSLSSCSGEKDVLFRHGLADAPSSSDVSHSFTMREAKRRTSVSRRRSSLGKKSAYFQSSRWPSRLLSWDSAAAFLSRWLWVSAVPGSAFPGAAAGPAW